MDLIAVMATYPGRRSDWLRAAESISSQVDRLIIVLNEYKDVPPEFPMRGNYEYVLPDMDLKDTGKFCNILDNEDYIILCDDDLEYPKNYTEHLLGKHQSFEGINGVVGVHGVIYPDFFDGDVESRLVYTFSQSLQADSFVNQLGTGTVLCRGYQMPTFEYMRTSQQFVDLRFAVHCAACKYPLICVERESQWLTEIGNGPSIFETFTKYWDASTVREAQSIAGFRYLHSGHPSDYIGLGHKY